MNRRGFTLLEMVMSLALVAMVAALATLVVIAAARPLQRASSGLVTDRIMATLEAFLIQELRDARRDDVAVAAARTALSRPIAEAIVCADSGDVILLADTAYVGTRPPQAIRDRIAIAAQGDTAWQWLDLAGVGSGHCPATALSAMRLSVTPHTGTAAVLRVWEPVELDIYRSGAWDWFGVTPADHSSSVQPFAGPLVPGGSHFAASAAELDATVLPTDLASTVVAIPLGLVP